jgi:hypothetical protein
MVPRTPQATIVSSRSRSHRGGPRIAFVLAFVLVFGITILLWFPGAMSEDSVYQLDQARHGEFSDAHPPLMALLWRFLDKLVPGPLGMLLVNTLLYVGGLTVVIRLLSLAPVAVSALAVAAIAFFPPLFGIIGVIWKDIAMLAAFVCSLAAALLCLEANTKVGKAILLAGMFLILLYAVGTRHNAAAAGLPLLVYYARHAPPSRKTPRGLVLSVLVGALLTFGIYGINHWITGKFATKRANFWQVLAIYDIAGASFFSDKFLFQPPLYASRTMESVRVLYSPRSALPLLWGKQIHETDRAAPSAPNFPELEDPNLLSSLARNWREVVLHRPLDYLHHRWAFFRELTGLTESPPWAAVYFEIVPNNLGVQLKMRPIQFDVFGRLYRRSLSSILFRPYLYIVAGILALGLASWWRLPNREVTACLMASGLLHMIGLFFTAVSPDYRYSHWMVFCAVLAVAIVVLDRLGLAFKAGSESAVPIPTNLTTATAP